MEYSKISSIELVNFMSFRKAKIVFDETGIINIKGYNDSGKSAILRGLAVCLMDMFKSKQVKFIRDDEEYFRIIVKFEDGVAILRDKYRNGQSLYEMYKEDTLVFTTKQGNKLSKVTKVPDVIEKYLGLCVTDSVYLNYQSCVDRLPVVDTNGSENYQMFHEVLRMVEIHKANSMLNTDKNELGSRISVIESELAKEEVLLGRCNSISEELIDAVKDSQRVFEEVSSRADTLGGIYEGVVSYASIPRIPFIPSIDVSRLESINSIEGSFSRYNSIPTLPSIPKVDSSRLEDILELGDTFVKYSSIPTLPSVSSIDLGRLKAINDLSSLVSEGSRLVRLPSVPSIDGDVIGRLESLGGILDTFSNYNRISSMCDSLDTELSEVKNTLATLVMEAEDRGISFVKCKNCGTYTVVGEEHSHE